MYTEQSMRIDAADSIIYNFADCVCLRVCAHVGSIYDMGPYLAFFVYKGKQHI